MSSNAAETPDIDSRQGRIALLHAQLDREIAFLDAIQQDLAHYSIAASRAVRLGSIDRPVSQALTLIDDLTESRLRLLDCFQCLPGMQSNAPLSTVQIVAGLVAAHRGDAGVSLRCAALRQRGRTLRGSLLRLTAVTADVGSIYRSCLQALFGDEKACRYGPDGRLYTWPLAPRRPPVSPVPPIPEGARRAS